MSGSAMVDGSVPGPCATAPVRPDFAFALIRLIAAHEFGDVRVRATISDMATEQGISEQTLSMTRHSLTSMMTYVLRQCGGTTWSFPAG